MVLLLLLEREASCISDIPLLKHSPLFTWNVQIPRQPADCELFPILQPGKTRPLLFSWNEETAEHVTNENILIIFWSNYFVKGNGSENVLGDFLTSVHSAKVYGARRSYRWFRGTVPTNNFTLSSLLLRNLGNDMNVSLPRHRGTPQRASSAGRNCTEKHVQRFWCAGMGLANWARGGGREEIGNLTNCFEKKTIQHGVRVLQNLKKRVCWASKVCKLLFHRKEMVMSDSSHGVKSLKN